MATADVQIPEGSMPDQKEISGLPEIRIEIQMYTPERMEKIKKQINGKSLFCMSHCQLLPAWPLIDPDWGSVRCCWVTQQLRWVKFVRRYFVLKRCICLFHSHYCIQCFHLYKLFLVTHYLAKYLKLGSTRHMWNTPTSHPTLWDNYQRDRAQVLL